MVAILYGSIEQIEIKIVVCSAYFSSGAQDAPQPQQVRELISDCEADRLIW